MTNQDTPDRFLDTIDIATPCSASWADMTGDERVRHCAQCKLNVYNLSEMTEPEATKLVSAAEGRVCVRFYRRQDGTVITKDCPVGIAAIKRRARLAYARVAAFLGFVCTGLLSCGLRESKPPTPHAIPLQGDVEMGEAIATPPERGALMGKMCPPRVAPTTAPTKPGNNAEAPENRRP